MLTLQMSKSRKYLYITCHPSYARRIHDIPAPLQFSREHKWWVTTSNNLAFIQKHFQGEIYYKTPKWFMDGLEEPPKKEVEFFAEKEQLPKLNIEPYDYQRFGAQFMIDRINKLGFCLNGDGVGSGKTIQSILTVGHFIEKNEADKILIVCKKSAKYQWEQEIKRFTNWDIPIIIANGTKKQKEKAYKEAKESEKCILITNPHLFINDTEFINEINWDISIIDEAHTVKGHTTKMNRKIKQVVCDKKTILLTATPVLSTPEDMYGIVSMASSKYFGKFKDFEKKHLVVIYDKFGRQVIGAKDLDVLNEKVEAFMIQRSEKEISVEMPEVTETPIRIPMDDVQRLLYEYITEQKEKLDSEKDDIIRKYGLDSVTGRMKIDEINEKGKMYISAQQFISDDPRCIQRLEDTYVSRPLKKRIPSSYKGSQKTEATLDLIDSIVSSGEKVIVFCHFSTAAELLQEEIEKKLKYRVLTYTGKKNAKEREECKKEFQTNPECNILIGTDSMAESLNFQFAKYEIQYEQAETDAIRTQRIGRIRRIGSIHSHKQVYDIITEESFDESRINKIARDKEVTGAVLGR